MKNNVSVLPIAKKVSIVQLVRTLFCKKAEATAHVLVDMESARPYDNERPMHHFMGLRTAIL